MPFVRMEVELGAEAQVDFGQGAWVMVDGKRKRPHLFRIVLSHSRKGYSEVVWRQTTESFIRCLENSFRYFGGVPRTLITDNLRAAVTRADWFDPELNPKTEEFCRNYGTVMSLTRPAMPRHKGKIESGINYGQENALKGRSFESLSAQNTSPRVGKAVWRTSAFTARPGNRWAKYSMKWNAPMRHLPHSTQCVLTKWLVFIRPSLAGFDRPLTLMHSPLSNQHGGCAGSLRKAGLAERQRDQLVVVMIRLAGFGDR